MFEVCTSILLVAVSAFYFGRKSTTWKGAALVIPLLPILGFGLLHTWAIPSLFAASWADAGFAMLFGLPVLIAVSVGAWFLGSETSNYTIKRK